MRPAQKIILSCRQTGELAERLQEWLEQSRPMLKAQSRALRAEVQSIASELATLIEAVEQPATAGVLGAWGSQRVELIGALMVDAPGSGAEDETRMSLGRDRLLALMPTDADGGQASALRFTSSARSESPYRFPIRLSLLSQLDLVKIIASAYQRHLPVRRQQMPSPDAVAQRLASKAEDLGTQSFSGMARRDIDGVREVLHAANPDSATLRELDAAGYWDTLGGLIPHLPDATRRRAFALLWGSDPALTVLFERLSDAIELLGFSGEAFVGLDALTGRDQVTGWITRHEDSLIATSTLFKCHASPERAIRVSSRHGRATDVERFVLAALAGEVRLPVDSAALPVLETADLLVLPAPSPVLLWPQPARTVVSPDRPGAAPLSTEEALELFAAGKDAYLADRAVRRHELTSLVVVTDLIGQAGASELDAISAGQVADWVELAQGDTAQARERRRTGLSILAATVGGTMFARDGGPLAHDTPPGVSETVTSVLDGQSDWANEWTPNRPFRNVFLWRPQPSAVRAGDDTTVISADILRFDRARAEEAGRLSAADPPGRPDLAALVQAMTQATTLTVHHQQLSFRLVELRRALTARFLRLHISNDPIGIVEWRRQICHVARNRLDRAAGLGGFGRLQQALMVSEREVLAVLARMKTEDPRASANRIVDLRTLEPQRIVEQCLEAWIVGMRQMARAQSLARAVRVPGVVIAHMIDELTLGAVRIGLQEKLTEAVRRIQQSVARAIDCEHAVAALVARGVNAYVETLDPGMRVARGETSRDTRFGMSAGTTAQQRQQPPGPERIAGRWAETFGDLVEANILGASLLGGAGHLNRELGEVLSAVSAQAYEGLS